MKDYAIGGFVMFTFAVIFRGPSWNRARAVATTTNHESIASIAGIMLRALEENESQYPASLSAVYGTRKRTLLEIIHQAGTAQ